MYFPTAHFGLADQEQHTEMLDMMRSFQNPRRKGAIRYGAGRLGGV